MTSENIFALSWVIVGVIGGLCMAYDFLPGERTFVDKIMTFMFCLSIGTLFGYLMLGAIPDAYETFAEKRRTCIKNF